MMRAIIYHALVQAIVAFRDDAEQRQRTYFRLDYHYDQACDDEHAATLALRQLRYGWLDQGLVLVVP